MANPIGDFFSWAWRGAMGIKNNPDNEISSDLYNVLDEDGNVIKQLRYPHQSEMAKQAEATRAEGGTWKVYDSKKYSDELYEPVSFAKTSISIDPIGGRVSVSGPSWLTGEIIKSDSFQQNVVNNSSLKSLIAAYRQDPDATLKMEDGTEMTAAQALGRMQGEIQDFADGYARVEAERSKLEDIYGIKMNDEQLSIANSAQIRSSADYNSSAPVYLPRDEEFMRLLSGTRVDSFNGESHTVTAKNFFDDIYKMTIDDGVKRSNDMREYVKAWLEDAAKDAVRLKTDKEFRENRGDYFNSDEYKDEVARFRAMYTWLNGNEPEKDGWMSAITFMAGVGSGLAEGFSGAFGNISELGLQFFDIVNAGITNGDKAMARDLAMVNPAYQAFVVLGELSLAMRSANLPEFSKDLGRTLRDLSNYSDKTYAEAFADLRKEYDEGIRGFGFKPGQEDLSVLGGGSFAFGEFVGHITYKAIENHILLNPVGKAMGGLLSGTKAAEWGLEAAAAWGEETIPLAAAGIKAFSSSLAGKFLNFAVNVGTQSVIETLIDDKDLIDAAFATGDVTDELRDKIIENTVWNAIGEATPYVAGGSKKLALKTTPGKALDLFLVKASAATRYLPTAGKARFFRWLGGFKTDAAGNIIENAEKSLSAKVYEYSIQINRARKALLDLPFFKEMTEEQKQIYKDATAYILTGKTAEELAKGGYEAQQKILEQIYERTEDLKPGIKQNYEYMRLGILNRMNIENNFDAILRGEGAKLNDMNAYAGKSYDAYSASLSKTLEMEKKAKKAGAKLESRKGSLLSKESSEYLSYTTQRGRYEYLIENKKLKGKKLEDAKKYLGLIKGKLSELEEILGKDLTKQLSMHLNLASDYFAKCLDYMMAKGYFTKEAASIVLKLRSDEGWGKNGEFYVPTARLFGNADYNKDIEKYIGSLEAGNMIRGNTIPSGPKAYQMGNVDDSFMDPTMVIYTQTRAMASAAQAQDMWRALRANNLLSRTLKGFDKDGFSDFEMTLIQEGSGKLKKDFMQVFGTKSKDLSRAVRESFSKSRLSEMAFKSKSAGFMLSKSEEAYKTTLVNTASTSDVTMLLGFAPENVKIPNLDTTGVTGKTFDDWFKGLPKNAQTEIVRRLGGQNLNIRNVRKLLKDNPEIEVAIQKSWLNSKEASKIWETKEAKEFLASRAEADATASGNILLKEEANEYLEAQKLAKQTDHYRGDQKTYRTAFARQTKQASDAIIDEMIASLGKAGTADVFSNMVKTIVDATDGRVSEEIAQRYVVLLQLNKMSHSQLSRFLFSEKEFKKLAKEKGLNDLSKDEAKAIFNGTSGSMSKAIKKQLESELNAKQKLLADNGAGDVMDLDTYWESIKKYQSDIMKRGGKWLTKGTEQAEMDRHIVKAVDGEGKIRYYETDPSTAMLVNTKPTYKELDPMSQLHQNINQFFRAGTTGFDKVSYFNQWSKDPVNAVVVGGALPFTDLGVGGAGKAFLSDFMPFGQKLFGDGVTEKISQEIVDSTHAAAREGLAAQYGDAYVKAIEEDAAKGLTGEAAAEAQKRAIVEHAIQRAGYESMPSTGMREAESYRVTSGSGTSRSRTIQEVRQEQIDAMFGGNKNAFNEAAGRMQRGFDNLMSEHLSRGQWRETFLRKSVFTTQYKLAIKNGMTDPEARIWASRYAMDATTNFGRPLPIGNKFFRQIPYFSAAINGAQSFYRLLELDPVGVMSRISTGIILPYMALLTQSLSDPKNLEGYKQLPEYEKDGRFVFFYEGHKISFPMPEELGALLNPFRHMIEKSVGANDNSWLDLVSSDALGLLPVDLSGFVPLDKSTYLDNPTLGDRIYRGMEKALSSLMPPAAKATYMLITKRDPYTGKDISVENNFVFNDEGEMVPMDYCQSEVAWMLHKTVLKDVPASGVQKILNAFMGRSTLAVADKAAELFTGEVQSDGEFNRQTLLEWVNSFVTEGGTSTSDALLSSLSESRTPYSAAAQKWQRTVKQLNDERSALVTSKDFMKAYTTLQSASATEAQKESAMQVYRGKLDEYQSRVLEMAIAFKKESPFAYTASREAQVVSLLTLPTGYTYNETAAAKEMRQDAYYDAKDQAIATYVKMGFPEDHTMSTMLGYGYYDSYGNYKFKIYTPYEIQYLQGGIFGTAEEVAAEINQTMSDNNIKSGDMWEIYYSANNKAERKRLMALWNQKTVPLLAPIVEKYGVDYVVNNSTMSGALGKYIYAENSYKKKQYLKQIFGGAE